MLKDIPITQARHELTALPSRFNREAGAVRITRRGQPVLAIMSWEFYESLVETMEIMADSSLIEHLRQGIKEADQGKGVPWEKAKKELGL